jgi:hypothetical protein
MMSVPSNPPVGAVARELISKYSAWAAKLDENIASLARQRRVTFVLFVSVLGLSLAALLFASWLGVAVFLTGVLVCAALAYVTGVRAREFALERGRVRDHLAHLEREGGR